MRLVEKYKGSDTLVTALDDQELAAVRQRCGDIQTKWYQEWLARGAKDEGSCCMGVGVSVYHLRPGKRKPERVQVISWTWSQGDLEADRTRHLPLGMLAEHGVLGVYDCGRMD